MTKIDSIIIEMEVLSSMLLAAIEVYPKECGGIIFGEEDLNPKNYRFDVWYAVPHQDVQERSDSHIVENPQSYRRLNSAQRTITGASLLGGFHSHPDAEPSLSVSDIDYIENTMTHRVEIVVAIDMVDDEGPMIATENDLEIQGSILLGENVYGVRIGAYFLNENKVMRLEINSGYIDILDDLKDYGNMHFNTIGNLFERAIQVKKADFELRRMIKELEYAEKVKDRRAIVKNIKSYLTTP